MRKPFVAANWKMNLLAAQLPDYFQVLRSELTAQANVWQQVDVAFAAPYLLLPTAHQCCGGDFLVTAQNVHQEPSGAYTGEIAIGMLKEAGVMSSLVGHSERRQYFSETDEIVAAKTKACLQAGMLPIVCIGETRHERESRATQDVLAKQLKAVLPVVSVEQKIVFAYEPVWAIGTGLTATDEQAQEAHAFIRGVVQDELGKEFASSLRILYGGSAKPENFSGLLAQADIDGGLVGGASLKPKDFAAMILQAAQGAL